MLAQYAGKKHEHRISQSQFVPNHLKHLCVSFTSWCILSKTKMLSEKHTLSSIAIKDVGAKSDQGPQISCIKWEFRKSSIKTRLEVQDKRVHHSETTRSLWKHGSFHHENSCWTNKLRPLIIIFISFTSRYMRPDFSCNVICTYFNPLDTFLLL